MKKKSRFNREDGKAYLMLLPYIILFSTFILVPVLIAVYLSFTYFDVINEPTFTGLLNYITLFTQDEVFLKYVLPNTFLYALIVGPGGYVLSFLLAWMLAQIQPIPRTILALCIYTPSMLGQVFRMGEQCFAETGTCGYSDSVPADKGLLHDDYDYRVSLVCYGYRISGNDFRHPEY